MTKVVKKSVKATYGHLGHKHSKETKEKIAKTKRGKKASMETRNKMHESQKRGKEHHSWKGGLTPLNKKLRNSFEYKLWREAVFKRDNWTCVWCRNRGGTLNADHIKPFALFPELRFSIDNGRTLCVPCHKTTDSYLSNYFKNYK